MLEQRGRLIDIRDAIKACLHYNHQRRNDGTKYTKVAYTLNTILQHEMDILKPSDAVSTARGADERSVKQFRCRSKCQS